MGIVVQNPGVATSTKVASLIDALRASMDSEDPNKWSPDNAQPQNSQVPHQVSVAREYQYDVLKELGGVDISGISQSLRKNLQDVLYRCIDSEDSFIVTEAFRILTKSNGENPNLLKEDDSIERLALRFTEVPISALGDSLNIRAYGLLLLYEHGATDVARKRILEMLDDSEERPKIMRALFGTVEACDKEWLSKLIEHCKEKGYTLPSDIQNFYRNFR